MRSWGLESSRGFTGQRGRGSAPSAALGALRTEPPPCVPGMRLVQYQLFTLSGCGRLEDGAPAPRARWGVQKTPVSVSTSRRW